MIEDWNSSGTNIAMMLMRESQKNGVPGTKLMLWNKRLKGEILWFKQKIY